MFGVVMNVCEGFVEDVMCVVVDEMGVGYIFVKMLVGVFFGEFGCWVFDLYFGGVGFDCIGCIECGNCMVGCCVGVKNIVVKNYLVLVEWLGVEVIGG